jgi:hypothetical protein
VPVIVRSTSPLIYPWCCSESQSIVCDPPMSPAVFTAVLAFVESEAFGCSRHMPLCDFFTALRGNPGNEALLRGLPGVPKLHSNLLMRAAMQRRRRKRRHKP